MTKEELENSIGLQLNFFQFSGASAEDTIRRILNRAEQYANHKAIEVAGDSWDAGQARLMYESSCEGFEPDRETYLSNLKKKIEA